MLLRIPALLACAFVMQFLGACGKTGATRAASTPVVGSSPLPDLDNQRSVAAPSEGSVRVAAGSSVEVEIAWTLDSDGESEGEFKIANMVADVKGTDGGVAITANSHVVLIVREASKSGVHSRLVLGLQSISAGSKSFRSDDSSDMATLVLEEDGSRGASHRSVHLEKQSRIIFKLLRPIQAH